MKHDDDGGVERKGIFGVASLPLVVISNINAQQQQLSLYFMTTIPSLL